MYDLLVWGVVLQRVSLYSRANVWQVALEGLMLRTEKRVFEKLMLCTTPSPKVDRGIRSTLGELGLKWIGDGFSFFDTFLK